MSTRNFLPINHGRNKVTSTSWIDYRIKAFLKHARDLSIPESVLNYLIDLMPIGKLKGIPKERRRRRRSRGGDRTTTEITL